MPSKMREEIHRNRTNHDGSNPNENPSPSPQRKETSRQNFQKMESEIQNLHNELRQCLLANSNGGLSNYGVSDNPRARSIQLTRTLTSLKKKIVPQILLSLDPNLLKELIDSTNCNNDDESEIEKLTKEEGPNLLKLTVLSLFTSSLSSGGRVTSGGFVGPSIFDILFSVINDGCDCSESHNNSNNNNNNNNNADISWGFSTTEGHREMCCDILKEIFRGVFSSFGGGNRNIVGEVHGDLANDRSKIHYCRDSKQRQLSHHKQQIIMYQEQAKTLQQLSVIFQNRMSRYSTNSARAERKGTSSEPVESSEYIRLLLVELLADLVGYMVDTTVEFTTTADEETNTNCNTICLTSSTERAVMEDGNHSDSVKPQTQTQQETQRTLQKILLRATSDIANTLSKSALLDPYPDVQRASCVLIEQLTRLCPLGVQMNCRGLLAPLTGMVVSGGGGSGGGHELFQTMPSASSTMVSKSCLFRHRHAKTRCKAVEASVAIAICCRRGPSQARIAIEERVDEDDWQELPDIEAIQLNNSNIGDNPVASGFYGSRSVTMEQVLHDTLLAGWQDLLMEDSSASVRISVLNALEKVSCLQGWEYSSPKANPMKSSFGGDILQERDTNGLSQIPNYDTKRVLGHLNITTLVESRILALFMLGMSDGNVDQVQATAIRGFCSLNSKNTGCIDCNRGERRSQVHSSWYIVSLYFAPTLEILLNAVSYHWTSIQSKVRSLEALRVVLVFAIPMTIKASMSSCSGGKPDIALSRSDLGCVEVSKLMTLSIVNVLTKNILSDEKDVLEAALACCRCLGNCDTYSNLVLELLTRDRLRRGTLSAKEIMVVNIEHEENNSAVDSSPSKILSTSAMLSSPRQMTAVLLLLASMLKGYLSNKDAGLMLQRVEKNMSIHNPTWFNRLASSNDTISSILCNSTVIGNVSTHSSLAWALLDICSTFAKCVKRYKNDLNNDVTVRVLVCLVYLLGCPENFGLSNHAMNTLLELSAACNKVDVQVDKISLLDVHFRQLLPIIVSTGSNFPWKCNDPSFKAMDALLRCTDASTVGRNFDIVAPFFMHHLSTTGSSEDNDGDSGKHLESSIDCLAEEYSLRISLMCLLQSILSDGSFTEVVGGKDSLASTQSIISRRLTTDVLLSVVLPNLVWRSGGLAASLRKLSAATLFSLLRHHSNGGEQRQSTDKSIIYTPENLVHLIPILHSNLEDTESTTRELCCHCLSIVLEQVHASNFQTLWEKDTRVVDTLYPRLLALLDDSHDPVRVAVCRTLEQFLHLACNTSLSKPTCQLGLSSLDSITSSLMIHLDDPDSDNQSRVFQVLMLLLNLQNCSTNGIDPYIEKKCKVVEMIERHTIAAKKAHRDGQYCDLLLNRIHQLKQQLSN